ncbi:hypothetical protein PspLS_09961 [Pyricularia sp. CBS 133598]|nr:hypothetical protein PspLS_09961 [Pyricularia sp. CBS 133598]
MRFELSIFVAFMAHLARSNPVLPSNLQARTIEDGSKHPTRPEAHKCEEDCAKKGEGGAPGRQSRIQIGWK